MEWGKIEFELFGVPFTAIYDSSNGWVCDDPSVQEHLEVFTSHATTHGYMGEPAREMLEAALECVSNGRIVSCAYFPPNTDPGVVH